MVTFLTRSDLYKAVRTKPMATLAPTFGVSNGVTVALTHGTAGGPFARVRIPSRCPALPGRGLRGPVTEECAVEKRTSVGAATIEVAALRGTVGP